MDNTSASSSSNKHLAVQLDLLPVIDEEDDLDTQALAGSIRSSIEQELLQHTEYTVDSVQDDSGATGTRSGIDFVLLITLLGTFLATYKDMLTNFFQMITTIVEVAGKRGRIEEIEIIVNGKTIILRDVQSKTAQQLIASVEAHYPGTTTQITSGTPITVNARVSKQKHKKSAR